jgi:hypothetical protein
MIGAIEAGWAIEQTVDILAYAQTLPTGGRGPGRASRPTRDRRCALRRLPFLNCRRSSFTGCWPAQPQKRLVRLRLLRVSFSRHL